MNYLAVGSRNWDLSHLPDLCKDSRNSWGDILFHSLESFSRILCNCFMKSGSFRLVILHLLWRAKVYLRKAKFIINKINLYSRFVFYDMFEIPTYKYRDIMYYATGNVKRVGLVSFWNNFMRNIASRQYFDLFANWKYFYRIFFDYFYEVSAQLGVRSILNFRGYRLRTIKREIPNLNVSKELLSYIVEPFILTVKTAYNRCINIYTHNIEITQQILKVKGITPALCNPCGRLNKNSSVDAVDLQALVNVILG